MSLTIRSSSNALRMTTIRATITLITLVVSASGAAFPASSDANTTPPAETYAHMMRTLCPHQTPPTVVDQHAAAVRIPQQIDLSECFVPELHDDMFATFGGDAAAADAPITVLTIRNANVSRIGPMALSGLRQLRTLSLAGNALSRLEQWAPHYFNALETLDVANNRIATIADESLRPYPNLQTVRLNDNRIALLPDALFAGTARLLHIDLSGNRLTELSDRVLGGLRRLQTLSLANNRLGAIGAHAFAVCGEMHTLRLDGNVLQRLDARLLAPLRALSVLNISRNALQVIDAQAFAAAGELRQLDLSVNRLGSSLQPDWSAGLRALETLDLSGNKIPRIHPLGGSNLGNLQQLNLSANHLTDIADATFARLVRLQRIDLSDNRLESIATAAFAQQSQLQWLDLAYNQLNTENFLQPVAKLRHLRLAANQYHTMNLTTFFHFHNVDLSGNPWSCTWLIEEMMAAAEGIYFGKNYSIDGSAPHPMTVPGIDCTDEAGHLRSIVVLQVPEKRRNSYVGRIEDETETSVDRVAVAKQQNKTIRKMLDDEFDYKACLIWTAVAVIAVFSMVHIGKVFFARSEKNSEKYRLSQQVGLLGNIETTLSMPPKFSPFPTSPAYSGSSSPLTAMTPMTPMTPLTPITPPLSPATHQSTGRGIRVGSDRRHPRQHNVYFARHEHEAKANHEAHK